MNDRGVTDAFVAHLRDRGHAGLRVERRPDQENPSSSDIDAIAGPFAIEHTSIDSLPNQRRDSDWFMRAAGGLESEIPTPSFRLSVTIEYDAVGRGQNWREIREALKTWVAEEAPHLPDGMSVLANLPGIPFQLHVVKSGARRPGIFFARFEPSDESLSARVRQALDRKAAKLAPYRAPGVITILLVESADIALMNEGKMLEAIQVAYPRGLPLGVDQLWYVDSSMASALEFRDFTPELRRSGSNSH